MQICVYGVIYRVQITLEDFGTNTGTLNNSSPYLPDVWADEGIVQVHLAGSPQADIWRALTNVCRRREAGPGARLAPGYQTTRH